MPEREGNRETSIALFADGLFGSRAEPHLEVAVARRSRHHALILREPQKRLATCAESAPAATLSTIAVVARRPRLNYGVAIEVIKPRRNSRERLMARSKQAPRGVAMPALGEHAVSRRRHIKPAREHPQLAPWSSSCVLSGERACCIAAYRE